MRGRQRLRVTRGCMPSSVLPTSPLRQGFMFRYIMHLCSTSLSHCGAVAFFILPC